MSHPVRCARRILVALVLGSLLVTLASCRSVDFVPSERVDFGLGPELDRVAQESGLRAWHDEPPSIVDQRYAVYYALEITDASGTDQWLIRVQPTGDRLESLARFRRDNRRTEERTDAENDEILASLLRGFTHEFGDHANRWVADLDTVAPDFDLGFESATDVIPIYVDTIGPINRSEAKLEASDLRWSRSERFIPIVPAFFAPDFPAACEEAATLMAESPDATSPTERHRVLDNVVRAKMKIAQGLFMIMGSPALRKIADRVMEKPSVLAYANVAARWLASSESGFVEWLGRFTGIRFDNAELTPDSGLVQFRFEPRVSTTSLLKTEITAAGTTDAPLLSAGFVTIEGINPYDSERRFQIRLLGWTEREDEGVLLSSFDGYPWIGPTGRTIRSLHREEVWLVPRTEADEPDAPQHPRKINSRGWKSSQLSADERWVFALLDQGSKIEVIDLDSTPLEFETLDTPTYSSLETVVVSLDDRLAALSLKGDDADEPEHCLVVDLESKKLIGSIEGFRGDRFDEDGNLVGVRHDHGDEHPARLIVRSDGLRLQQDVSGSVSPAAHSKGPDPSPKGYQVARDGDAPDRLVVTNPEGEQTILHFRGIVGHATISDDGLWLTTSITGADGIMEFRLWDLHRTPLATSQEPIDPVAE